MSSKYTAQMMRKEAHQELNRGKVRTAEMLRQAADDKERLEAVEKIAELRNEWFSCRNCAREFLRAARGKGGAK